MKYEPKVGSLRLIKLKNFQLTDQEKKKKAQMNNIRFGKDNITTDPSNMRMIIWQYYEQVYTNKFDNLDKIDKIFRKYNLPKLAR